MKLSIVIPIYKVENYIEKCIFSCIDQGAIRLGEDYEIICVNDGTPDKSAEIAKRIASDYIGITVLDQENQGLSGARNTGIDEARGSYIWFVDSDDWIERDCLSSIWTLLRDNLDMLHIQHRLTYDDRPPQSVTPCLIDGVITGVDQTVAGGLDTPAQFTLFRRDFLIENGLRFMNGILHEDCEFKPRALLLAKKVTSSPIICYNYYQRNVGNIMSSFNMKHVMDFMVVLNSLYNVVEKYPVNIKRGLYSKMAMWLNEILLGYWRLNKSDRHKTEKLLKKNKHILMSMTKTGNTKYTIEGYTLLFNAQFGLRLYKLLKR